MKNEYFTPAIEDIRVGYEYEQYHAKYYKNNVEFHAKVILRTYHE